jgi:hypothetical protein
VAAILSVVESCRRLRIPLREYLAHSARHGKSADSGHSFLHASCMGGVPFLNNSGFRQQNRIVQLLLQAFRCGFTTLVAVNQLMPKLIPNVVGEVFTLRTGSQKLPIQRHGTLEVSIDVAVAKSQI